MPEYTHNQLLILHHLKRYGPITRAPGTSILQAMSAELGMKVSALTYQLRTLEAKCLVLRTYGRPATRQFGAGASNNPLTRLELVDPNMNLPPIPQVYVANPPDRQRKPTPLGIVMADENEDLEERIEHRNHDEPTVEAIVEALIDRALELQKQVDKLQDVIAGLNTENERLRQPKPQAHVTSRVRDVLTQDQWDALRRKS
jgi:hypothetical protein